MSMIAISSFDPNGTRTHFSGIGSTPTTIATYEFTQWWPGPSPLFGGALLLKWRCAFTDPTFGPPSAFMEGGLLVDHSGFYSSPSEQISWSAMSGTIITMNIAMSAFIVNLTNNQGGSNGTGFFEFTSIDVLQTQ
jgi:hypothetical protein